MPQDTDENTFVDSDAYILCESKDGVEFYVHRNYGLDGLKRCQERSLEMLREIVTVFERHGIDYFLAHGALLGLIRHGGFIPWDDDCDLFVFEWDYARAISLLRKELPTDMLVHNRRNDPIYWPKWTKIRDVYSDTHESLWKIDRKLKYHGICVDILRVTMDNEEQRANTRRKIKALRRRIERRTKRFEARSTLGKMRHYLGFKRSNNRDESEIQALQRHLGPQADKMICVGSKGTVIECSFEIEDALPTRQGVFEGVSVALPARPANILTSLYGKYEELPPVQDRRTHFDRVIFFDSAIGDVKSE